MAEDKKNPKEASNIFHSIMKASVSKTATKKKVAKEKATPKSEDNNENIPDIK
jgi:hypothetical protein